MLPTILVCVAMLEGGLRVLGRMPSNVTDGFYEQHEAAYRMRANMTKVSRTPSFTVTIHTNQYGLRDEQPGPRELRAPYVAFLGDSLTFGNGVDYPDTVPGVYASLSRPRGVDVMNLAVGGYHLAESQDALEDFLALAPAPPALVVYVFASATVATFDESYSGVLIKDGYIFDRDRWAVPYALIWLGNASASYCFFRDGARKLQSRFLPHGDPVGPVVDLFSVKGRFRRADTRARFDARLAVLEDRVRRAKARLAYVYLPTSVDLRAPELLARSGRDASQYDLDLYRDVLRDHAARAGVTFVDLTSLMRAEAARGRPMGFLQDPHYNAQESHLIGEALYAALNTSIAGEARQ